MIDAPRSWLARYWVWLALVVIGAVHLPALGNEFVDFDDDKIFLQNETLRSDDVSALGDIFAWDRPTDYRPVRDVSHWIDHLVHGQDPFWAHLHNWVLLLGVVFVFSRLLRRLGVEGGLGLTALLLAFVHPVQVETIAWVSGRKDLLAGLFLFGACWAFLRFYERPRLPWALTALGLMVLGMFSKGHIVVAPVIFGLLALHGRWRDLPCPHPRAVLGLVVGAFVVMAALLPRIATGPANLSAAMKVSTKTSLVLTDRLQLPIRYLKNIFWPSDLNHIYMTTRVDTTHLVLAWVSVGLGLLVFVTALWWCKRRDGRGPLLLVACALIVPYLHFRPSTVYLADRYLFCLLPFLAVVVVSTGRQMLSTPNQRLLVSGLVVVVLSGVSVQNHGAWRDSISLWTRMTEVYPESDWGYDRLGRRLYAQRQFEEAAGAFLAASARDPKDSRHLNNAAVAAMAIGRNQAAVEWLRRAVTIDPKNQAALRNLKKLGAL